jgi:hypothetical protein
MNNLLATVRNGWSYRARLVGAGLVVGGVVSGGLLFATIPDQDGVLHGCYKPGGAVRVIDSAAACKASEVAINWNVTGPKGDDGSPGATGPSDAFVVDGSLTFSSEPLNTTTFTTLASIPLPAGSFVVNGTAAFAGNSSFGVAQCGFRTPAGPLSRAMQTTVGGSPNSFGTISLTAAFTLPVADEVSISCRGNSSVVTQDGAITAIQVQTVTDLTH